MKLLFLGSDESWNELNQPAAGIEWIRAAEAVSFLTYNDADAYFNMNTNACEQHYSGISKPVFINSTVVSLKASQHKKNVVRINGWNGFLKRVHWEVAGELSPIHEQILQALEKKYSLVPDEPGFISARIIALIINEAYFAKAENVSTENEIDTAMKLGTNYPFGPFEWAAAIGEKNVYDLLVSLSKNDSRYKPSSALEQKVKSL